jgi:S1-C subfamily serine protease
MFAVLVCCASYILSVWYVHVTGPEAPGLDFGPGWVVDAIRPGSAADRAGLQRGDVVESVNAKTGRAAYLDLVRFAAAGRPYELQVDCGGERRAVTLVLGRKSASYWATPGGLARLADVLVA